MRIVKYWSVVAALALAAACLPAERTGGANHPRPQAVRDGREWHVGHQRQWNQGLIGTREQIAYRRIGHRRLTFYLFQPGTPTDQARPVLIYIHGGGLKFGTGVITDAPTPHNRLVTGVERAVLERNMDFVSVNYRLAPMHPWPIPLHDVEDAVAYLHDHAGEWNIKPDEMSVMGDSAGGELASFVGLTMWHGEEPAVRGVVDLFGPTDRQPFAEEWRRKYGLVPNPVYGLYTPQRIWSESVVSHVRLGAPPFLIIQGTRDRVVPPIQSELLKERLQEYAVPVKEILVENAGHELVARGGPISPDITALITAIADFVAGLAGSHQPH